MTAEERMSEIEIERLRAEIERLRAELREATHELHCCDDIPLDGGLTAGIAALQRAREAAEKIANENKPIAEGWRQKCYGAQAEIERLRAALRQIVDTLPEHSYSRLLAIARAALSRKEEET
jgi:cell division septum initiation protein DivIVA